jgi:hypothetical protein
MALGGARSNESYHESKEERKKKRGGKKRSIFCDLYQHVPQFL